MANLEKDRVIEILEEIATLLEMKNENVFKIRAFANAARVLDGCPSDLKALVETGELEKLKGIGKGHIARIVRDLCLSGRSADYDELRKGFPPGIFELLHIPGVGAKRIKTLYDKLSIRSLEALKKACAAGRIAKLDGFGDKSQEKILNGIEQYERSAGRFLIHDARAEADKLVSYLKREKAVRRIGVAGSLRRHKEVIRDLDVLVATENPKPVHDAFVKYPGAAGMIAHGDTKSTITLANRMNCDLRTVTEEEFAPALYYFTGSKEHNVAVRTLAKRKNLKVNEYGVFRGSRRIPCATEEDIFRQVGLHYIPPEARENTGEIELARKSEFPRLVEEKDLRGVFHVHSDYSDGVAKLEDMVATAEGMGYEYVGISDHSQSAKYAHGMEPERVYKQWKEIDRLQKRFKICILKGIESDILADGALDYPEDVLRGFDFVIGSIHSRFTMPEKEMTGRLLGAMENRHLTFIGHPTGRLLLAREGYAVQMEKFLETAVKHDVTVELNADPHRLDLDWRLCQQLKKRGGRVGIHPDAHSVEGMKNTAYGVGIARKGWLEKKDVANTLSLADMLKFLKKRR